MDDFFTAHSVHISVFNFLYQPDAQYKIHMNTRRSYVVNIHVCLILCIRVVHKLNTQYG